MTSNVLHTKTGLIINMTTNTPAHLHLQLLRAINHAMKMQLLYPNEGRHVNDVTSLAELQITLMPTEKQLEKAFEK